MLPTNTVCLKSSENVLGRCWELLRPFRIERGQDRSHYASSPMQSPLIYPILWLWPKSKRIGPPRNIYNDRPHSYLAVSYSRTMDDMGHLGGSAGRAHHALVLRGFEPCVGLCAASSEPGACFWLCVSLSLCPSPACILSLKYKWTLKKNFF